MKYVSLLGIAAVTVLGTDLGAAQAAFAPNKVVINDVTLTDTAASQQIFAVNPTNGQSVQSATYTQDVANNTRYSVWGHVGGENAGVGTGTATVQDYTDSASVTKTSAFVLNTAEGPGGGMQFLDAFPINQVTTNSVRFSFSLNIVENAGDADDSSFNGAAFAANLFANSSSATRFIAAPNGASGGKFGLTKADGSLFEVANYVNDKFYDIDVDLNFVTQQATLSVDGKEVATNTTSFTPSVFDVTKFVTPGKQHAISVLVKGGGGRTTSELPTISKVLTITTVGGLATIGQ